jgi:tetratricopeptide (TPR) repeat protein
VSRLSARIGVRAGLALASLSLAAAAAGQDTSAGAEIEARRLHEASALEQAGDWAAAESVLRSVLADDPTSLNAILSLDRVLSMQRRIAEILPVLDTLIAREPATVVGHQMRIRALSLLNEEARLASASEAWMQSSPALETPYREIARVYRSRGSVERAVEVLERGRRRVGRVDALALELGDVYAQIGDTRATAREWSRAVGPRGEAFLLVQRRLMNLPGAGASVIPGLIDALVSKPTTTARMRAAVHLAIDSGLREEAERIAVRVLPRLTENERRGFLIEVGRRAEGSGFRRLALWAYGRLVAEGGESELLLPLRSRMAELALGLGDTLRASELYREVETGLRPGSAGRRQAMSLRAQMLAREGQFDSARVEIERLEREPASALDVDASSAVLANALIDAGRTGEAVASVARRRGPHATLARGRAFMAAADMERARVEILSAAPGLEGTEATGAIALAALLGRLSSEGGALVGRSMAAISAGDPREGIMLLYGESERLERAERSAILDYTAGLADRAGLAAEADQIRRDIIAGAPESPEAPLALLALARTRLRGDGGEEARQLLERFVSEYPRSALVPQARRELDRLASQKRQP